MRTDIFPLFRPIELFGQVEESFPFILQGTALLGAVLRFCGLQLYNYTASTMALSPEMERKP